MDKSGWSFAIVNGKLAEVFFVRKGKIVTFQGFCHVKRSDYKTKREQRLIETDTNNVKLKYTGEEFVWLNKPRWVVVRTGKIKT